jgi:hypothetical protein
MKFVIDENLANQLLNYLASRPYAEVHGLVKRLQAIQPLQEVPAPELSVVSDTAETK